MQEPENYQELRSKCREAVKSAYKEKYLEEP